MVSGAGDECPQGNDIGGITDFPALGGDLIAFYEGVVAAASHIIERVANAL
jgi:hypothetical protein